MYHQYIYRQRKKNPTNKKIPTHPPKPFNKLTFQQFHLDAKFLLSGNFKLLPLNVSLVQHLCGVTAV